MGSKKVILKLDLHDDKDKQKAMKVVSKIPRIDSITMDMKDMKLTVIGDVDPITVVNKLRKFWNTDIAFVGPAKEPEKKKDGGGGGGGGGDPNKKKDDSAGKDSKDGKKKDPEPIPAPYNPYMLPYYPHNSVVTYNPHMYHPQHVNSYYPPPPAMPASYESYVHEENPNGCAIC